MTAVAPLDREQVIRSFIAAPSLARICAAAGDREAVEALRRVSR